MIRNMYALITRKDIIKRKAIIYRHNILKKYRKIVIQIIALLFLDHWYQDFKIDK